MFPFTGKAQREITLRDTLLKGFSNPESVIADGNYIYVSNLGKKTAPSAKDADGFISRLTPEGKILELKFISGLDAPKGMAIIGKKLFVTDIDKIKGFDLKTGKEIFSLSFEKEQTNFLNDLCVKDSLSLFVSATDKNAVYQVKLNKKTYSKIALKDTLFSPNGLFYLPKEKTLYVATMSDKGKVYGIVMNAKGALVSEVFSKQNGLYDGLWISSTEMIVSDWGNDGKGRILFIKNWKEEAAKQQAEQKKGFTGPADFYFDEANSLYYFPEMLKGTVRIIKF